MSTDLADPPVVATPRQPKARRAAIITESWVRWPLYLALAAVFTAIVIHWSLLHGRLRALPYYDDVEYFNDALSRLDDFYTGGLTHLAHGYWDSPSHSPLSMALALLAYMVMGPHDWAPYVANGLIIVALLALIDRLCRQMPLWQRVAMMLLALATPVAVNSISEFRPDMASALATASGAVLLLEVPLAQSSARRLIWVGALFGLGALSKPPTFPLTGLIFGASMLFSTLLARYHDRDQLSWDRIGRAWAILCGSAFVVAAWHFALDWHGIYGYIFVNVFGKDRGNLATGGQPLSWHLRYYIDGRGGTKLLGMHLYFLVAVVLFGIAATWRSQKFLRVVALVALMLLSIALPVALTTKQEYFGATFAWLLLLCAVVIVRDLAVTRGTFGLVSLLMAAFLSLALGRFPEQMYANDSENADERVRTLTGIYDALVAAHINSGERIYLTATGFVNDELFNYLARLHQRHAWTISSRTFDGNLKDHQQSIDQADYVLATSLGNGETFDTLPSGGLQDKTLAYIRSQTSLFEIARIPCRNGKSFYLFRRSEGFDGLTPLSGIGPTEGPYPMMGLPRVRWGEGLGSALRFSSDGLQALLINARPRYTPTGMRILIDGREIGQHVFADPETFEELSFDLDLPPGEHRLELQYDPPDKNQPLAILFRELRVVRR